MGRRTAGHRDHATSEGARPPAWADRSGRARPGAPRVIVTPIDAQQAGQWISLRSITLQATNLPVKHLQGDFIDRAARALRQLDQEFHGLCGDLQLQAAGEPRRIQAFIQVQASTAQGCSIDASHTHLLEVAQSASASRSRSAVPETVPASSPSSWPPLLAQMDQSGWIKTERVGFEPTEGFPSNDFESFAFDHSATSPDHRDARTATPRRPAGRGHCRHRPWVR